jgi:hypothetical protein
MKLHPDTRNCAAKATVLANECRLQQAWRIISYKGPNCSHSAGHIHMTFLRWILWSSFNIWGYQRRYKIKWRRIILLAVTFSTDTTITFVKKSWAVSLKVFICHKNSYPKENSVFSWRLKFLNHRVTEWKHLIGNEDLNYSGTLRWRRHREWEGMLTYTRTKQNPNLKSMFIWRRSISWIEVYVTSN